MQLPSTSSAITGSRATIRLGRLDLTEAELQTAVRVAYTFAAQTTKHDPPGLAGTMVWGRGIGHLRDLTKPRGWTVGNAWNFETTVHPSKSHAVAVASGTSQTGHAGGVAPRTKTPKGEAMKRAVNHNVQLPGLQETDVFANPERETVPPELRETWLLLHYFDRAAEIIRLELSSPKEMIGEKITSWRERIILAPVPFSSEVHIPLDDDLADEDVQIDIAVPRKPN
jgi:hypothetical protein